MKGQNILNEIDEYLKIEGLSKEPVEQELIELKDVLDDNKTFPVCVLSHMFDKRRSKLILEMMETDLDREYIIFTYADQKELYEQFEEKCTVHYIPTDDEKYLSLCGKRQYIVEYCHKNGYDDAFLMEDDCHTFQLPYGAISNAGNYKNNKFYISLNLTFRLWEFLAKKYNFKYSGPQNNMEFTFKDLSKVPFIKDNGQVVQATHVNVKSMFEKGLSFDDNSGWDDYDMNIQQCVYNEGTKTFCVGYVTPNLKSGVSAMSATANALAIRCEKNTKLLMEKWNSGLVRLDTKKGLYNAKVNWFNIKKAYANGINPKEIIGMTNEEAKSYITNKINEKNETYLDEW